jgi:hypothetical protein
MEKGFKFHFDTELIFELSIVQAIVLRYPSKSLLLAIFMLIFLDCNECSLLYIYTPISNLYMN